MMASIMASTIINYARLIILFHMLYKIFESISHFLDFSLNFVVEFWFKLIAIWIQIFLANM